MQRWFWVLFLAMAVWLASDLVREPSSWPITGSLVVLALAASWFFFPWRGSGRGTRKVRHDELMNEQSDADQVRIYWRPGCGYCARLRSVLGSAGERAIWLNIWADDSAAEFVRSVNDGNETVPTVVMDGMPHTNPDPETVLAHLTAPETN